MHVIMIEMMLNSVEVTKSPTEFRIWKWKSIDEWRSKCLVIMYFIILKKGRNTFTSVQKE